MPKIARKSLTKRIVESAAATGKLYRLRHDHPAGLMLRVTATGAKSWAITWARGQELVIGKFPQMTLAAAEIAARAKLSEVDQHGAPLAVLEANRPDADKPLTLGAFVTEHYAPWALAHQKAGQATIDGLAAGFGFLYETPLRELAAFDIERFKAQRLKAGKKPATVNRDLDRIRGALSRAVDWNMLDLHPLRTVKRARGEDNSRVRYLTPEEETRLREALAAREATRRAGRDSGNAWSAERGGEGRLVWPADGFTGHLSPMVLVAINTGLRRGELFGVEWGSVNLAGRLITVTAGNAKSRKARHVPLNREAVDVLTRWKAQGKGAGLVFPSPHGGRLDNINKAWGGITDAAALDDFRFHDLRHTFASKLVMAGVDLNTVRELLGHSDLAMTLRYSHLAPEHKAAAVELLAG